MRWGTTRERVHAFLTDNGAMDARELAERMGCPVSTVRHALTQLHEEDRVLRLPRGRGDRVIEWFAVPDAPGWWVEQHPKRVRLSVTVNGAPMVVDVPRCTALAMGRALVSAGGGE